MLEIQGRKYAAVSVCDVTLYDLMTKYPVMYFDTLQVTNLDSASEVTEIQGGKGNPVLASISHSKNIDVQFDDAIMTMSSLALLTGGELNVGHEGAAITMTQTELAKASIAEDAKKVTVSQNVKANSYVYIGQMKNGVVSTVTRSEKPITGGTKEINLASLFHNMSAQIADGDTLRVFYEYEVATNDISELTVLADKFAGMYRFVGDTMLFNQFTGLNDVFQIEIPKLKLDGTFSLNLSSAVEAAVFSFKGKALRDDEGRMIIFRNIKADENKGDTEGATIQMDGSNKDIPAKGISVNPDTLDITDLDPAVTYPSDSPEEGTTI